MTRVTDICSLTNPQLYLMSGVVAARATYFWVDSYNTHDPLYLIGPDFDNFVKTFMPKFVETINYDVLVETSNTYKMRLAEMELKSQLHHQFTVALLHNLVYGCDHESDVMDCIDFNTNDSYEVDGFNSAVKDGDIKNIFDALSDMKDVIELSCKKYRDKLIERHWIFESGAMFSGIHHIGKNDIIKIAESIELEFEHNLEKTTRYMQNININKIYPVDLTVLHRSFSEDLNQLFSKGGSITYADFCDFVVKYGLHESKSPNMC